jgi:virulence factor Mce-like protein
VSTTRSAPHHRRGISRERAAIIAIILVAIGVYFAFNKSIPFREGYRVNAYVENAMNIKPNAPVRIAGVNVGKVVEVSYDDGSPNTKLVLRIDDKGRPIHSDASLKIRPRNFLEGSFFVDLKPGSPSAPEMDDGESIPIARTASSVQFDQLLSMLNRDTREGFQVGLREFAGELYRRPTTEEVAAADPPQDPDVAYKTAFEALNGSLRYAPDSIRGGARILRAFAGEERNDVRNLLQGFRDFGEAINNRETQVLSQIVAFDTMLDAFAGNEQALADATKEFSRTVITAEPTARKVNAMLPNIERFANLLADDIDELPATIEAADPWIEQTNALLQYDELGSTANMTHSVIRNFAAVMEYAPSAVQQIGRISACWNNVIYPAFIQKIDDGGLGSGRENYKEFWYSVVGMASESQTFDGNGAMLRLGGSGSNTITTPSGKRFGNAPRPQAGIRPALPTKNPPIQSSKLCYQQTPPNVNGVSP